MKLICTLLLFSSTYALDFCVGDVKGPEIPMAYLCKPSAKVTFEDLEFTGLGIAVYLQILKKGDVMIFPQGLLLFQLNAGGTPAIAYVNFSDPSPDFQILDFVLFANNLSSTLVEVTTFLDDAQVKKLKSVIGDTS
ncbi:hypothetical protein GIB67_008036 [Kingdonia uniflora]|uniref:Germin-like protein n=1 Tax=Kingdonia uniflora TaxID=39325 RepID=A0A7J7MN07_9MAGN|nr:hypothetical protein GIB67_008036 [Kingdonia uniflora]